jgi:four helix bundle protein
MRERERLAMLRIQQDAWWMVREVYVIAEVVERRDGDLARQMRRASSSVVLNLSEGSYSRPVARGDAMRWRRRTRGEARCSWRRR